MTRLPEPVTLFLSYSHKDEQLRQTLEAHLSVLRSEGLISPWHDRQIAPGAEWAYEIDTYLETASIILLLVSPDFLASDYCAIETQRALERRRHGAARVIPIILRPCDWRYTPLKDLQCLPRDGKPVTRWQDQDEVFNTITQSLREVIGPEQAMAPSRRDQNNRIRMLKRVRKSWIEGLLEKSLQHATGIELGLQDRPDMLENPLLLQVQEMNKSLQVLPDGTTIVEVHDKAEGELLILGEPGAGKTTLLLELTRTLLERTEKNEWLRIPIVFNLSSWAEKRQSLDKWLVEELRTKYQVPRKIGQAWIDADQVLPLLDGLDEVAKEARSACVQQINNYYESRLEESGSSPIVVCCRSEEYAALSTRVKLQHAVSILPLTNEQINTYMEQVGEPVKGLRQALEEDAELHSMARQPLMLNIFMLAYQGATATEVPTRETREELQRAIFAKYVESLLERREQSKRWQPKQVIHWLTFLAKQMKQRNQTQFLIERLQTDWLSNSRQCQLYTGILCGLLCFLFVLYVEGMITGSFLDWLRIGLLDAIVFILLNGILFVWLTERDVHVVPTLSRVKRGGPAFSREEKRSKESSRLAPLFTQVLLSRVGYGFLCGLFDGIAVGFLIDPVFGLVNGLFYGSFFAFLGRLDKEIQPTEILVWSWTNVRHNATRTLIGGLCVGFLLELFSDLQHLFSLSTFFPSLFFGLTIGLVLALLFMLIGGFSRNMLDTRKTMKPNQGIWTSFYNSTRLALIFGPASGLVIYLLYSLVLYGVFKIGYIAVIRPSNVPIFAVTDGLDVAALIWAINGGLACIQHLVLRVLLWQTKCAPWNYPRFLDYASERILLRKVGGGYIFVHRLLLEYFASLESPLSAT